MTEVGKQHLSHIHRAETTRHHNAVPRHLQAPVQTLVFFTTTILVLLSIVVFFMDSTCGQVSKLLTDQNIESLKLRGNLEYFEHHRVEGDPGLPPGLVEDLIEFSRTNAIIIRTLYRLRVTHLFSQSANWNNIKDDIRYVTGKDVGLDRLAVDPGITAADIVQQGINQIKLYQDIRDYAQDGSVINKNYVVAITTYILPCLYALLGAFLYVCRRHACVVNGHGSRYAMAFIIGGTISAIGSLVPKDIGLSPLAIAFIAGYSVDSVTSQLDRLVGKMKRPPREPKPEDQLSKAS
jgi:hypothetical protein